MPMVAPDDQLQEQLKRHLLPALDLADRISPMVALQIATALDLLDQGHSSGESNLR